MKNITKELLSLASKTIAMLAVDGVEKANSGHPGMPMGMADVATVLWLNHLRFNPSEAQWINRDRFVLSNGHGSMLLYSLLHLAGFGLSIEDLKNFRQWGSKTPGHPEFGLTAGVESTTGPLGQGISNAVGMAVAGNIMATRYNTAKQPIFKHHVYCFAGDGCLMEGISSEASSLAGHLGLGNLVVFYDDNHISIAGDTSLAFTENVLLRYQAYGWQTLSVDGHDLSAIDQAIEIAKTETGKPTIIACRTIIGKGSPNKANSHGIHGAPLGNAEIQATKQALGWPLDKPFHVPAEVQEAFKNRAAALQKDYRAWQETYQNWQQENIELAQKLKIQLDRSLPADIDKLLSAAVAEITKPEATRKLSETILQVASKNIPALIGGSADLEPSTLTFIKGSGEIQKDQFSGVNLRFGVREHGMGAIANGLAYYGGFIPYSSTFLVFSDYMRGSIRVAALSHLPALYIFTHDSIFVGEDGPTHQPIEHVGSLRMIPNLYVFRPADGLETAICYSAALARANGPSVLSLTRQTLPQLERLEGFSPADIKKGAYLIYKNHDSRAELVFVATGSEVALALAVAKSLEKKAAVQVVSMPCYELFARQDASYKEKLIPAAAKKITLEAGSTFGWLNMVQGSAVDTLSIGIDSFGASAPYQVLAEKYGLSVDSVKQKLTEKFSLS
ncbi:MAG: transketolase [Deltaproteobacteria bacterium]|nr:transketolase [Deltaproteobacteria bacterium]